MVMSPVDPFTVEVMCGSKKKKKKGKDRVSLQGFEATNFHILFPLAMMNETDGIQNSWRRPDCLTP